jgi:peptidoglycan/LPS O-acetylase OafA/YrhL
LMRWWGGGGAPVNLFFTLSGYLVGGLLLKEVKAARALNAGRFLARRALKIWPPLYALVFIHALLGRHDMSGFFWQNLLHVQNYYGTSLNQTWSLAVEEHFYILLAVLLTFMSGQRSRTLLLVIAGVCSLTLVMRSVAVYEGHVDAALVQTQFRLDSLLYGVALAAVKIFHPKRFEAMAAQRGLLMVAVVCLGLFVNWASENILIERSIGYAIQGVGFSLLLVLVCAHSGGVVAHRWYRVVAWIGVYSYGIYLWHSVALEPGRRLIALIQVAQMPSLLGWAIVLLGQLVLACAVGYVMTQLVEWPALKLRDRLFPVRA